MPGDSGCAPKSSASTTRGLTIISVGVTSSMGPWFDAVPTLTAAATVTSTIRLGTHVASANFRHPVAFARQVTALDDISNGRFLLGVGAGGPGFDSAVLGQSPLTGRARADRYAEFVELLDRVLCNHSTTWEGDFFSAIDARSAPGSLQSPRIPFIVAGNARRSIGLAARFGDGWMTTGAPVDTDEAWWKARRGELREVRRGTAS